MPWSNGDLTAAAGATQAAPGSALAGHVNSFNNQMPLLLCPELVIMALAPWGAAGGLSS